MMVNPAFTSAILVYWGCASLALANRDSSWNYMTRIDKALNSRMNHLLQNSDVERLSSAFQIVTQSTSLLRRSDDATGSTGSKRRISEWNGILIYNVSEDRGQMLYKGNEDLDVYPVVGTLPVRIFTNSTVEVGYSDLPDMVTTLSAGITTTISRTPIVVGTETVKIGSHYLPMVTSSDVVASVSSMEHARYKSSAASRYSEEATATSKSPGASSTPVSGATETTVSEATGTMVSRATRLDERQKSAARAAIVLFLGVVCLAIGSRESL